MSNIFVTRVTNPTGSMVILIVRSLPVTSFVTRVTGFVTGLRRPPARHSRRANVLIVRSFVALPAPPDALAPAPTRSPAHPQSHYYDAIRTDSAEINGRKKARLGGLGDKGKPLCYFAAQNRLPVASNNPAITNDTRDIFQVVIV
jgi:hypothetical protein